MALSNRVGGTGERRPELVETRAGLGADRNRLGLRDELARLLERELERLRVDGVGLRHRDDAALDPEQVENREVLVRLRARTLGGVDDEQEEVDPGRPGDHVADEALVAGNIDQREAPSIGKVEWRVAEVDRDSTRLLLGQPIRVLPGQRPHEPGLAVVDVPRGPYSERHASTAAATSAASASVSVRQSSRVRPSRTTATTGGSCARSAAASSSSTAQAKLGSSASGSAPPPTRATVSSTVPPVTSASRSARPRTRLRGLAQHPQHRDLLRPVEVERERALERGERQLVRAERAVERVAAQPLDEVRPPGDDPRLRPAEQLVAGEADEVGARSQRRGRGRLALELDERARAEVVDERQPVPPRDGRQLLEARLLREADDAEVRLVDAEEQRRLGPDRPVVVGRARSVRRPDLDEPRARAGEHVRDPEAVADLDQLPARDDDLAALGQRGEGEQDRGGVVVDDDRRLGARQPPQQRREVVLARAARTARQVVLEVGVAADLGDPVEGGLRRRRAPEVRVDQHAGGVEHPAERRPACGGELLGQPLPQVAGLGAGANLLARALEQRPRSRHGERIVHVPRAAHRPKGDREASRR